jgi:predicted O-linked N-acetylglucosamine transferase (SPINDLY family)
MTVAALLQSALAHHRAGRIADAEALYRDVLQRAPQTFEALYLLGVSAAQRGDHTSALDLLTRGITVNPASAEASYSRALTFKALNCLQDALTDFDRAIALEPGFAAAHNDRGIVLSALKRPEDALKSYDQAVALKPDFAAVWNNRALVLAALGRHDAALESYDAALALSPGSAGIHNNRGNTLGVLKRHAEAAQSYRRALHLDPHVPFLRGSLIHARLQVCDWSGLAEDADDVMTRLARGEQAAPPFEVLLLADSPALQRKAAEIWAQAKYPPRPDLGPVAPRPRAGKIRIGYFSADFHNHATMALMAELFERHDKSRFELFAFSFGPDIHDAMRARAVAAFDSFIDVRGQRDDEIAGLARKHGIDIAVDLKGFTQDSRPGIFSRRAAPVQAQYLGYPGTMGAGYIDYIIADRTLIPAADRAHYVEKIVYLPDTYQVNDTRRAPVAVSFSRAQLSLPPGFVFCCVNISSKIMPHIFARWMSILRHTPGSVLWLLDTSAAVNLRREAAARGVDAGRLIFAPGMAWADHLARLAHADLCLDTQPYGAHTTASDALWAGVPVLTCAGGSFAARVAASLLKAAGLPEMITTTLDDYEACAVNLARHPERIAALKQKLAGNLKTAPLFDTARFTLHLEEAFEKMIARYESGLAPDHITVGGRTDP